MMIRWIFTLQNKSGAQASGTRSHPLPTHSRLEIHDDVHILSQTFNIPSHITSHLNILAMDWTWNLWQNILSKIFPRLSPSQWLGPARSRFLAPRGSPARARAKVRVGTEVEVMSGYLSFFIRMDSLSIKTLNFKYLFKVSVTICLLYLRLWPS